MALNTAEAQTIFSGKGKNTFSLGIGNTTLYSGYEDIGDESMGLEAGYYYGRDNKFFALADFHIFKGKQIDTYFSSSSLNFSIGFNLFQLDNFALSALGGFGFYLPKGKRKIDGVITETESKLVFGTTFGTEAYLSLSQHFGFSFRYQYHNPFKVQQEFGPKLDGHYSMTSINILYSL